MKYISIQFIMFLMVCAVTACQSLNDNFSCRPAKGMSCQSLDKVNNYFDHQNSSENSEENRKEQGKLTAWFTPYYDREGHYHYPEKIDIAFAKS